MRSSKAFFRMSRVENSAPTRTNSERSANIFSCAKSLTAAFDQGGFQQLMLPCDRLALENVLHTMLDGIVCGHSLRNVARLAVGCFDHLAQCPLLEKTDLTELLSADLFIGRALDLFGAGLVDNMGDLCCG